MTFNAGDKIARTGGVILFVTDKVTVAGETCYRLETKDSALSGFVSAKKIDENYQKVPEK